MKPEEVKAYYTLHNSLIGERVVDVEFHEGTEFVTLITVSPNHLVWKQEFEIINRTLHFLGAYLMTADRGA